MADARDPHGASAPAKSERAPGGLESTATLLTRVKTGDPQAREALVRRFLPPLQRWARGRLPSYGRDLAETDDIVQITLLRALDRVEAFEPTRIGAFMAYLRRILENQIKHEIRRSRRRSRMAEIPESLEEPGPSPLERALGGKAVAAYQAALAALPEKQREAIIMKVEMGLNHTELAEALGAPSANAARMYVSRALLRLAEEMHARGVST